MRCIGAFKRAPGAAYADLGTQFRATIDKRIEEFREERATLAVRGKEERETLDRRIEESGARERAACAELALQQQGASVAGRRRAPKRARDEAVAPRYDFSAAVLRLLQATEPVMTRDVVYPLVRDYVARRAARGKALNVEVAGRAPSGGRPVGHRGR